MIVTKSLPPLAYPCPMTLADIFLRAGGSAAGYHAVSSWLECPERSRLRMQGVSRKPYGNDYQGPRDMNELDYGTLCHALRAVRIAYGHETVLRLLELFNGREELTMKDFTRAKLLFEVFEMNYPRVAEPYEWLGIECEVVSDVGAALGRPSALRTVIYDTVVRLHDLNGGKPAVFSLECKTMARSGTHVLDPYIPQFLVQTAVWNANPYLVETYGPMHGVIPECLVKTTTPSVNRRDPFYVTKSQQRLALKYMLQPETLRFPVDPETGKYPQMLHACWGRWRPCDYVNLCHEDAWGDFQLKDGETYDGR